MDLLCDTKADKNLNCEQLAQLYLKTACKAYYVSKGQGKGLLKSYNQTAQTALTLINNTIEEYYDSNKSKPLAEADKVENLFGRLKIQSDFITKVGHVDLIPYLFPKTFSKAELSNADKEIKEGSNY